MVFLSLLLPPTLFAKHKQILTSIVSICVFLMPLPPSPNSAPSRLLALSRRRRRRHDDACILYTSFLIEATHAATLLSSHQSLLTWSGCVQCDQIEPFLIATTTNWPKWDTIKFMMNKFHFGMKIPWWIYIIIIICRAFVFAMLQQRSFHLLGRLELRWAQPSERLVRLVSVCVVSLSAMPLRRSVSVCC